MEKKEEVYYELNRKYVTFYNSDLDLISIYREEGKTLEEIIRNNKISVILGDKGSGKTTEIRHFYLQNKNNSLYISLKDIYSSETNFQQKIILLKEKNLDNIFLLFDSIDECRIQSTTNIDAFDITLDKIREILIRNSDVIQKIKIIFTSRRSDWFDNYDRKLIQEKLNINSTSNNQTEIIQNKFDVSAFQLMDLDESRQNIIAQAFNIDVSDFREDIFALEYSKTPLDCIEFIRFKIRNKNKEYAIEDFLKYKLQRRYRELNEERLDNQLSMTKIEFLSKRLAAATLFRQNISIIKNETYKNIHKENKDISVFDLFPEEDFSTLNHFLNSTLFISNGENTVKFWDELCKYNIAYIWLKDRIANGKYSAIKNLLFQKNEKIFSPKQNLIVPIVFLSNEEPEFRKYLIDFNPELLFLYSYCIESLTDFDKKRIIDNLFKKYPYRIEYTIKKFFMSIEKSFISFSRNIDIEHILDKLCKKNKNTFWENFFLLKTLQYSKIDCVNYNLKKKLNSLLDFFAFRNDDKDLKEIAIVTLLKQKSLTINEKIKQYIIKNISVISGYTLGVCVENLYPDLNSFVESINLLNKYLKENKAKTIDILISLKIALKNLIKKREIKIKDLKDLLDTIVFDFNNPNSLCLYIYLLKTYVEYGGDENDIVEYLLKISKYNIEKYNILLEPSSFENKEELEELKNKITTSVNVLLAEKIFENFVCDDKNSSRWLEYNLFLGKNNSFVKFLLDKTKNFSLSKEKVFHLFNYCLSNIQEIFPNNYKNVVKPYLNTEQKKRIWREFISYKKDKCQKKQKGQEDEYEIERKKIKRFLLRHLKEIKKAQNFDMLINLSFEKGMKESSDISFIEKKYGNRVAMAYKQGIQTYWQICDVDFNQYVNEVVGTNKILTQTIAALTGLHIFFDENKNIILNEDKAKRIIYWGIQELNTIPKWVEKTILQYPKIAKEVILPIIDKIIKENKESFILEKLSRLNSEVLSLFYEDLWNILNNIPQSNINNDIIKIIANMNLSEKQKTSIIKHINKNIDNYGIEKENVIVLFKVLYDIDINMFVKKIINFERKYRKKKEKFKTFCEKLFGKIYFYIKNNNNIEDNRKLVDLIPLLFKYISTKEDRIHKTSPFVSTSRDFSQHFRDSMLQHINMNNFKISDRKYLLNLLSKIEDNYVRNYISYVADELLTKNEKIFSEQKIINIENEDYLPPENSDDLFEIVCDKLYEIKSDIETSAYSLKNLYQDLATENRYEKIKKEKLFQKYILMELRRLSRNLYSSIREPEENNNKKPDLQIWDKNWCVNIECKIANNWSGKKLLDTIDKQLIKKYLKYPKYQHGILLLAKVKKKKWEIKNKSLNFVELVKKIQEYADKIKEKNSNIKGLKVIGIDYS